MNLVRLALPTALVLWFVWKARDNRLFLLGIPVLMVMRGSVFFDEMRPFWTPGRFDPATHLMGWLFLVWVVTGANRWRDERGGLVPFGVNRMLPEELALSLIGLLMGGHALVVYAASSDPMAAVSAAGSSFYILMGFLLVRGIVSRATREETQEFLGAVVLVNTLAAALYFIHQGLHVPIYRGVEYYATVFGGQEITRTYHFAPQFSLLALGFVLAKREWNAKWFAVLGITMLSILVSYTRTLLIAALVAVVVAVVARELRRPNAGRLFRRAAVIVVCAVGAVFVFNAVRPLEFQYLLSRLGEFSSDSSVTQVSNWQNRANHWRIVQGVVAKQDPVLGLGYPEPQANAVEPHLFYWTSDMTWVPILYRFGYVGLMLFALVLGGFAWRALRLSLRPPEVRRHLSLAYFITIVLTVIVGFTSWTFMEPRIYPMGLWVLGFVAAEALRREADQPEPG